MERKRKGKGFHTERNPMKGTLGKEKGRERERFLYGKGRDQKGTPGKG